MRQVSVSATRGVGLKFICDVPHKIGATGAKYPRARYLCACGREFETSPYDVRAGKTRSCGCYARRLTSERSRERFARIAIAKTHGMSGTPLYECWMGMRRRCGYTGSGADRNYAHVRVCEAWSTFAGFLARQPPGRTYSPGLVLARSGDQGDYEPSNCRWATRSENAREAKERLMPRLSDGRFASDVAVANGIRRATFNTRIRDLGWDVHRAVTEPSRLSK